MERGRGDYTEVGETEKGHPVRGSKGMSGSLGVDPRGSVGWRWRHDYGT